MSKKSIIDSVEVKSPCSEDWNKMTGTNRVRFCSHCAREVNNISEMRRKEAMRLVRAAANDLCIRYIADPVTRSPLFSEQLHQITRRATGIAAGVMSASISLSTLAYAQSDPPAEERPERVVSARPANGADETGDKAETPDRSLGIIGGTIRDLNGDPVPGISVSLYSIDSYSDNDEQTTNEEGYYSFEKVRPGPYVLRIESSTGVRRKIAPGLTLTAGQTIVQDLNVKLVKRHTGDDSATGVGYGFGGAMAMVEYSLPLSRAVAEEDIDRAREIIAGGARVNAKDKNYDDITPLFIAVENGNFAITRLLLDMGANVNAADKTGRTPLMFIDEDATPEMIKLLVRAGARINARDKDGNTALLSTIRSVKPAVLQALIDAGADVNVSDGDDETPLMIAADNDDFETVKLLVLAGADVNAHNKLGDSAWDKTSNVEIEKYLETYGAVADLGTIEVIDPRPPATKKLP